MGLKPNDSRNAYVQIADDLRRDIADGTYGPGERLPSTADLVTRYGVANMTVQGAFRQLREEGLIYSVHGRGTFVRSDATADADGDGDSADYVEIRDQLEALAETVGKLEQRLSKVERDRGARKAKSPRR